MQYLLGSSYGKLAAGAAELGGVEVAAGAELDEGARVVRGMEVSV